MASYNQRRGLQGVSSLKRKLRRMEKHVQSGIPDAMESAAKSIAVAAKFMVPVDTGELKKSIEYKQSSDGLSAVIGPSAKSAAVAREVKGSAFATRSKIKIGKLSKKKLFQFFKGYWIEFGTKGNAEKNIPAQPARPFMSPAFEATKENAITNVANAVNAQLKRVSEL